MILPLLLIAIGLIFFARTLGYITADTINVLWPLILVVVGLSMVSNHWFGHHCNVKDCWRCQEISFGDKSKKRRS